MLKPSSGSGTKTKMPLSRSTKKLKRISSPTGTVSEYEGIVAKMS
jgi:hypothetical protein